MTPNEWPIEFPQASGGMVSARRAGRTRLPVVRTDFFLDPRARLSEQERALMTAMLADLIDGMDDEIRANLPAGLSAANDGEGERPLDLLFGCGLLDRPDLIALLLKRADEERINSAIEARSTVPPVFLQGYIASNDSAVAAAAMELILARGRRRDRLGQLRIEFDDLSKCLAEDLAFAVAAVIRSAIPGRPAPLSADRHLTNSAAQLVARHKPEKAIETLTAGFVRALADAGKLDEDLLRTAAEGADIAIFTEALAHSAFVSGESAWQLLTGAHRGGLVLLLRMAGLSRDCAAHLLAELGDLLGIDDPGHELERFEGITDTQADEERLRLELPPQYRQALEAAGSRNG